MVIAKRFELQHLIGEGGTARVYLARDRKDDRPAAVKLVHESVLDSDEALARFLVEADLLERFDHPNILGFRSRGVLDDHRPWFATDYAAKGSLADRVLRTGVIDPSAMCGYALEVLDALQHVHELGIVHRDVKPENILVDSDDVALLCDFGVARTPHRRATLVGDKMGTPTFMAPEQASDPAAVTARADLYGMGATIFVSITRKSGMALLVDHMRGDALAMVPRPLRRVVARATAPRPRDRYATASEMAMDLAEAWDEL